MHDGKYFTTKEKSKTLLKNVDFVPSKPLTDDQVTLVEQAINYGALVGEGTVNARVWANEQSSEMNPRSLELLCRRVCEKANVEFKVLQVDSSTSCHVGSGSSQRRSEHDRSRRNGIHLRSSTDSDVLYVGLHTPAHFVVGIARRRSSARLWAKAFASMQVG